MTEQNNFFVIEDSKSVDVRLCLSVKSSEFTMRPLTDTVSRLNDGPNMSSCKPIANPFLNCYLSTCLPFLETCLKWLAEEMIELLEAPNLIKPILFELSTHWQLEET